MEILDGESGAVAQVAEEAASCEVMRRAVALAEWAGPHGRALTRAGVLRKPDVPAACAALGVVLPERFRSAGDIQDLHRPWTVALALGLLEADSGRASRGAVMAQWPPPRAALPLFWLDGLRAVCDETCQEGSRALGLQVLLVAVLRVLRDSKARRRELTERRLLDAADLVCSDHGLTYAEVDLLGGSSDLSRGFAYDRVGALLDLLAEFGAVTVPLRSRAPVAHVETRVLPVITPLGRWAAESLAASLPSAVNPDAAPAEVIAEAADAGRAGLLTVVRHWLAARKPEIAVRELLEAAEPMPARLRAAAVATAALTGRDGLPGWAAIALNAKAWPNSARHARAELCQWGMDATGVVPSPSAADRQWLAVEAAAAALAETVGTSETVNQGADEALCRLWEAAEDTGSVEEVLAWARASGHPEAARVSEAIAALAACGAQLTVHRGIQLKVALRYASPPIWRTVQVPLQFSLGDLHRIIQVMFGWDGDHLHAFTVGSTHYSDPFHDLDEAENEEEARLRDVFPAGARKPVRYEYDFGASWVHEISREKVFQLDPARAYPECVAFSGEQPVEYEYDDDDEDQPEQAPPFSIEAVNARLAGAAAPD